MNTIDVSDHSLTINGSLLNFPLSYEEIKAVLGPARVETDETHGLHITYCYDDLGLEFEGSPAYLPNLKKQKAYVDPDHIIISLTLYVTGKQIYSFKSSKPKSCYVGGLTFFGSKIDPGKMWPSAGFFGFTPGFLNEEGKKTETHVPGAVYIDQKTELYDRDRLLCDVGLTFEPTRPRSKVDYTIQTPDEPCLTFDNFNFKLAVINELMYNRDVLQPYFDVYDYMAFKKAHWNLETMSNIRAVVAYFRELPIPARFAELITEIEMDGSDDIYMHIAPEWDGEDDRFDITKLSEAELKQFPNLKKMTLLAGDKDLQRLRKVCDPLGIEIDH